MAYRLSGPSHHPNQSWRVVGGTVWNKLQWHLNQIHNFAFKKGNTGTRTNKHFKHFKRVLRGLMTSHWRNIPQNLLLHRLTNSRENIQNCIKDLVVFGMACGLSPSMFQNITLIKAGVIQPIMKYYDIRTNIKHFLSRKWTWNYSIWWSYLFWLRNWQYTINSNFTLSITFHKKKISTWP